jgi:hypothetical protein
MPRKARIDAPGALHHIICRGIERRKIFLDDIDRDDFVERLAGDGDGHEIMRFPSRLSSNVGRLAVSTITGLIDHQIRIR